MKLHIIARTAAAFAAAVIVSAAAAAPASARNANDDHVSVKSKGPDKKICLSATATGEPTVTGSILSRQKCLTRAEWEAKGVRIPNK